MLGTENLTWFQTLSLGAVTILGVTMSLLYKYQNNLLYFPSIPGAPKKPGDNPVGYRHPGERRIDYEDLYITTADKIKIHAWLLKHKEPKKHPTIIFFHGNAGNIGFRLPNAIDMYHHLQCNILLVDYRGYGNSEGEPTEEGLILDAEASLMELRQRNDIDPYKIFVFGRSLGGAVAVSLATQHPEKILAIILENTFLDISSMVDEIMPKLSYFKKLILRINWSNQDKIAQLNHPILFLAGGKDEIVPHSHMIKLHEKAKKSVKRKWFKVDHGTHNDTWLRGGASYFQAMIDFVQEIAKIDIAAQVSKKEVCHTEEQSSIPSAIPNMP